MATPSMNGRITGTPFSRYHQRVLYMALWQNKPKTKDRDVMDAWVSICSAVGVAIREQGGDFNLEQWMDRCYRGPK